MKLRNGDGAVRRGLPIFMPFQDGKVTATHLGAMSKSRLVEWLKESAPTLNPRPV